MRGHDEIIRMRQGGKKPAMVFINDWPCRVDWFDNSDHATVSTAGDAVEALDMRFAVGLAVSISAQSESRAKALSDACKEAGADLVAACHVKDAAPWRQDGWREVWRRGA
jgi:hypothetical protein